MTKDKIVPIAKRGYSRTDIFVTTKWLEEHINDPKIRILDTDSVELYDEGHIPNAANVKDNYFKTSLENRTHVQSSEQFNNTMSNLGISNDTLVIGYDRSALLYSLRLLWTLNYFGHSKVKILDGGYQKWISEGRSTSKQQNTYNNGEFKSKINKNFIALNKDVLNSIYDQKTQILDVRSDGEWNGTNKRGGPRGGHIPGALHLEWINFHTGGDVPILKTANEIRSLLNQINFSPEKNTITYCQGGIRAAHVFWVLKLIGLDNVKNYDGSWREWGADFSCPIE